MFCVLAFPCSNFANGTYASDRTATSGTITNITSRDCCCCRRCSSSVRFSSFFGVFSWRSKIGRVHGVRKCAIHWISATFPKGDDDDDDDDDVKYSQEERMFVIATVVKITAVVPEATTTTTFTRQGNDDNDVEDTRTLPVLEEQGKENISFRFLVFEICFFLQIIMKGIQCTWTYYYYPFL